jgi:hypothetical protein
MIADEIKELIHAEPFRPIRIVLGNEQSFVVAHTDYLMISPDRQTVLLYDQQGRFKIINAQQITGPTRRRRNVSWSRKGYK